MSLHNIADGNIGSETYLIGTALVFHVIASPYWFELSVGVFVNRFAVYPYAGQSINGLYFSYKHQRFKKPVELFEAWRKIGNTIPTFFTRNFGAQNIGILAIILF